MDTIHDLGGKQGFGPIPIGDNQGFHHDWERRMWAIARAGVVKDITIDWFRHGLERMVPSDYLSFAYFNKWCANYFMLLIDGGVFTLQEVISGQTSQRNDPPASATVDQIIAQQRKSATDFSARADAPPGFKVGDTVTTKRLMPANHTRLPAYARGATGTVITHHGAHLLADKVAIGIHAGEHLYTVSFSAPELWGAAAHARDTVTLELWESYFVQT